VVVVTGASAGIGAALAERIGALGGKPVLAARRERELAEVAKRSGPDALAVVADVSRREDVDRVRDRAIGAFGHIDVWVNNAGRGITRPVSALTDEDVDDMLRVNLKSALYGMQTVLPHFRERRRGHFINVSSMLGRVPTAPFRSIYSAAKHALNALTSGLRQELAGDFPDIHVSTVSPGVVATDFGVSALHGGPDSRSLPNAQPVSEVVDVLVDVIERPRADVYTRAGAREMVVAYFSAEDMGDAERRPPFLRGLPPRD
jgi:NAD(P)-dependent dehydrogenase (short-subunit alcohol dehydrogenase family)